MTASIPELRRVISLTAHGGPEVMRLDEEACPTPAAGEVLIDVEAAGVNFGDTLVRRGQYRPDAPLSLRPGLEVAGTVVATGSGLDRFSPGDRVAAFVDDGGYASAVTAPVARVHRIPDDVSAVQAAAFLIQGSTAWLALHLFGRLRAGDCVLVHAAAGGVGSLAVQVAVLAGARAIGLASTESKRQAVLAVGAEHALAPDAETLKAEVRRVTEGRGVNIVLDSVGGPLFSPSLSTLATGGRYVVIGAASLEPSPLDARRLLPRTQTISAFLLADTGHLEPGQPQRAFGEVMELVRAGRLRQEVTVMPLERVADAHAAIEARTLAGKVVLTP